MENRNFVLWLTGYSGAGKSTISKVLISQLQSLNILIIFLDGDELRAVLQNENSEVLGFEREARISLAKKYSKLSKLLYDQGFSIIVSTISLYSEIHEWNRINIDRYFEVFLNVSLDERKRRDPKGIYAAFEKGLLNNVAGLDLKSDEPTSPSLRLNYKQGDTPESQADQILEGLRNGGYISW